MQKDLYKIILCKGLSSFIEQKHSLEADRDMKPGQAQIALDADAPL
jgi:hypothetical protein